MNHLEWGLRITALGMGLVFGLLALLWGLLTLVLRLDGPPLAATPASGGSQPGDGDVGAPEAAQASSVPQAADLDPALVAAITVAVLTHDAVRRNEAAPTMRAHWPGSLLHASRWVSSGRLRQNRTFRRGR
jgi:Na+-transporting methylmalonyl-CoA/oxaloacetate decarboxylase gamma subunit